MTSGNEIASIVRTLYPEITFRGWMQRHRPAICPFELVVDAIPVGSQVLDIGCGSGLLLGVLAAMDRVVGGTGVDTSTAAISAAETMSQRLGAEAQQRLRFEVRGEAETRDRADVVTMIDVMHHIPIPIQRDAFARAAAQARPGGLFVYKDIGAHPRWRAAANRLHDAVMARQIVHYVPDAVVREWAASLGLTELHWSHHPRLWYEHVLGVYRVAA